MIASLPPGAVLILGALLVPLLPGRVKQAWLLALPLLSLWQMLSLPADLVTSLAFFDYPLTPIRVDRLALVFGAIFHLAAFLSTVFALHVRDDLQHAMGLAYAGSAIAAVFAGDLITLFVFWELTAVTSVFLIWASRSERSYRAGMRYLIVQVGSGVLLLSGAVVVYLDTGSLAFDRMQLSGVGPALIFLSFGIKCAFPFLHNWLQDSYPEATVTGTVFLSAFTTKLAVYALARGFPGTAILVPIGAAMTAFPIFYAVIENDLRRVLAYSLNNQLGFMVVGIGIGTEMSLNGTAAHAFCHILYKALLFMSMGAVLYRTGTIKGSELGGLYKSMPWTLSFCVVGAASISAFPFTSGFVSKSLILTAAGDLHYTLTWFVLVFASAGVFHHSGIKIPFFAFFAHDSGIRCKEAPANMLVAMGATAALCVLIGVFPGPLYSMLPYPVDFRPYTAAHVITQYQLLLWSALAFSWLKRSGIYPPELRSTNLDTDWVYRRAAPAAVGWAMPRLTRLKNWYVARWSHRISGFVERLYRHHGPQGVFARTWPTGSTVMWVAALLGVILVIYYV